MSVSAPLLNDYKFEFFWRRLLQTFLGGVKLRLGYEAPCFVYISQIVLFSSPLLMSIPLTSLTEYAVISVPVGASAFSAYILLLSLISQITKYCRIMKTTNRNINSSVCDDQNFISDEEEIYFPSCCSPETMNFTFTPKKHKINIIIHALFASLTSGLAFIYLVPSQQSDVFNAISIVGTILSMWGWVVFCIAIYPIMGSTPAEPATYRPSDTLELMPLLRPFYVILLSAVHILSWEYSELIYTNYVLHIVFPCLPVLWLLGILPPLDALFAWIIERVFIHILGASPPPSVAWLVIRLMVHAVFLATGTLTVYMIPLPLSYYVTWCAVVGMLNSLDPDTDLRTKLGHCLLPDSSYVTTTHTGRGCLHKYHIIIAFNFISLILVSVLSLMFKSDISDSVTDILGYSFLPLLVVVKILGDLQGIFLFFGVIRNVVFPWDLYDTRAFSRRKRVLTGVSFVRRAILNCVAPLMLAFYLCLAVDISSSNFPTFWFCLSCYRSFQMVWGSTYISLLEVGLAHLLLTTLSPNNTLLTLLPSDDLTVLLLILGFLINLSIQFYNKFKFMILMYILSVYDKKQRRDSTYVFLLLSVVFSFLILSVLALSTVLSAPLLPFFTLPVFLIGFPRPVKFWPSPLGSILSSSPDSVYYEQLTKSLVRALSDAFSRGSLGDPRPGRQYLVRYQDKTVWIELVERGYGYCSVVVRGLELQETSCHTVEATRIDDIFEDPFQDERKSYLNRYLLNVLLPCDVLKMETYSDARNVMTGIIDSHENLALIKEFFLKTVTWVLLQESCKTVNRSSSNPVLPAKVEPVDHGDIGQERRFSQQSNVRNHHSSVVTNFTVVSPLKSVDSRRGSVARNSVGVPVSGGVPASGGLRRNISTSSLSDSIWSLDSNVDFELEPIPTTQNRPVNLVRAFEERKTRDVAASSGPSRQGDSGASSAGVQFSRIDPVDDLFQELQFAMPAVDVHSRFVTTKQRPAQLISPDHATKPSPLQPQRPLGGDTRQHSAVIHQDVPLPRIHPPHTGPLQPPEEWLSFTNTYSSDISRIKSKFSVDWYNCVIRDLYSETDAGGLTSDSKLLDVYKELVANCYSTVTEDEDFDGPLHVFNIYSGNVKYSRALERLRDTPELFKLVLKAYRYAVKLVYDHACLGEFESHDEVVSTLKEYDKDWLIGTDTEPSWAEGVRNELPYLFSMGYDHGQRLFTCRVLTLQPCLATIGQINEEMVRGLWSSLALELYYFTNDDEERYSIQAHPGILRNITIQAADPPLGYPVYIHGALTIQTF